MAGFNPQDYETVDSRLHRFWDDIRAAKLTATVDTDLVEVARDAQGKPLQYVVKTTIVVSDGRRGTGLAEELVGSSPVNRTSALENAETSATGRALAQLGYSPKGARPSAEEMDKARRTPQPAPQPVPKAATNGRKRALTAVATSDAEALAAIGAVLDPPADQGAAGTKATPQQWAQLVALLGGKNAVVREANALWGDVRSHLDLTEFQAAELIRKETTSPHA